MHPHFFVRGRLWLLVVLAAALAEGKSDPVVAAYLPEWRYEGANFDEMCKRVTHLILFSVEMTSEGGLAALDRVPRPPVLRAARKAAMAHGTKLMICVGGNGRSGGFSSTVASPKARKRFLTELAALLAEKDLDGVDYNWEYPGYDMGRGGYLDDPAVKRDYRGLAMLLAETRQVLPTATVSVAYYPDGKQESMLNADHVDFLHAMAYDAQGAEGHSPFTLAERAVANAKAANLPLEKCTLGVPFYGRHQQTGAWTTYEDLVQQHTLDPAQDLVADVSFNGRDMIVKKANLARAEGLAGVMIWEVGQDCRIAPVTRGMKTHVRTCPTDDSSLLVALHNAIHGDAQEREL